MPRTPFFKMFIDSGGERRHFLGELRQRRGVAFGQLADVAGEGLRHAVQLRLNEPRGSGTVL